MYAEVFKKQSEFLARRFSGKTVLISGATGLIGSRLVNYIVKLNCDYGADIKIVALYRNDAKLSKLFPLLLARNDVMFVKCDIEGEIGYEQPVDYIVHCAGFSGGTKMHLKDPVKVFDINYGGTRNLLHYAVSHSCTGFLYVSTYEIYGDVSVEEPVTEDHVCRLDPLVLRNCYAEIKRVCESMLCAFSSKYGLNVYSVRLTSTFGAGVQYDDPRFFAEFARCAIENRNIVLKSSGSTVRSYLDADDAAIAFLYVFANGISKNAYNLTNMKTEVSIKEMAEKIIEISGAPVHLVFEIADDPYKFGMRKEGKTVMDASKIHALGWQPVYTLDETLEKLLDSIRATRKNEGKSIS